MISLMSLTHTQSHGGVRHPTSNVNKKHAIDPTTFGYNSSSVAMVGAMVEEPAPSLRKVQLLSDG